MNSSFNPGMAANHPKPGACLSGTQPRSEFFLSLPHDWVRSANLSACRTVAGTPPPAGFVFVPSQKLGSLCAGINRHDVENEKVSQERSSDPS